MQRTGPSLWAIVVVALLAVRPALAGSDTTETAADQGGSDVASLATPASVSAPGKGSVTQLPLPRFVSLKSGEGNARRGPSLTHRIDWVFRRRDMPLLVTAEFGNWRRVEDSDGQGGWVHYSLLSGVRTVMVQQNMVDLRLRPDPEAPVMARAEAGVVARLGDCSPDWCRISADGERGWVPKSAIWGVAPDEIRD